MTNLQAITAEIEPYSISDDSNEKSLLDSALHFGVSISAEDEYTSDNRRVVALAAMMSLNRLRVLSSENIGGISQVYDTVKLEKRIKAIAQLADLSASLVLADSADNDITFISM